MNDNKEKLTFLINRSNCLYQKYMDKPIYLYALSIKKVNCLIIDFLLEYGHKFNDDKAVNNIITHYEGWYFQFLEYEKKGFNLTSEFIFDRFEEVIPYPKDSINKILNKRK